MSSRNYGRSKSPPRRRDDYDRRRQDDYGRDDYNRRRQDDYDMRSSDMRSSDRRRQDDYDMRSSDRRRQDDYDMRSSDRRRQDDYGRDNYNRKQDYYERRSPPRKQYDRNRSPPRNQYDRNRSPLRKQDTSNKYEDRRNEEMVSRNKINRSKIVNEPFKIAFLFLVRDDINYPDIWENYFRGHEDKYTVYCHPKNPENVNTPWLKSNIIPSLVSTAWGQITDAYFTLINEALKNEDNKKFITISESCLPLRSFDELYNFFNEKDIRTSFIRFWKVSSYDIGARLGNNKRFDDIYGRRITFIKHYARFCLSRYHALKLLNYTEEQPIPNTYIHNQDLDMFNSIHVGDEFFLSILNPSDGNDYVMDYEITFDDWDRTKTEPDVLSDEIRKLEALKMKVPVKEKIPIIKRVEMLKKRILEFTGDNPFTYYEVNSNDITNALMTRSFFWRKFSPISNIRDYYLPNGTPTEMKVVEDTDTNNLKSITGGKKHSRKYKNKNKSKKYKNKSKKYKNTKKRRRH
jgi:hypothetical protein